MSEWKEFTAKTVDEALTNALVQLGTTSDKVEYEIIEKKVQEYLGFSASLRKYVLKLNLILKILLQTFLIRFLMQWI